MLKALALVLVLATIQEDPQVTYREGLFEEVDQGNLEKAAELYAKVLKGNAPDALKAKALLRTGFCHEKKGQKKEAEQAWRDVIERYPSATESVKVARDRMSRPETGNVTPQEDQIQKYIFNLGSESDSRSEARRMLLFLGDAALPALRRALLNRDRSVSDGAAEVLFEMGQTERLYDAVRPSWITKGDLSGDNLALLPKLLELNDADRKKFLKDSAVLLTTPYMGSFSQTLCSLPEPEYARIVEDWIVATGAPDSSGEMVVDQWLHARPPEDIARIVKRLAAKDPPPVSLIVRLFRLHASQSKTPDPEVKKELLLALRSAPDGSDYQGILRDLVPHFRPQELIQGPVSTWLENKPTSERKHIFEQIANMVDFDDIPPAFIQESRRYLFELLASVDVPLETKEHILASGYRPGTPEEKEKYLAFCVHYWKENRNQPESKATALGEVVHLLARSLPADSKELSDVLDAFFERSSQGPLDSRVDSPKGRPLVVAACLRFLAKGGPRGHTLEWAYRNWTAEEKISLGSLLGNKALQEQARLAQIYAGAWRELSTPNREPEWKVLMERYEAGASDVKGSIAQMLIGDAYPPVDEFMRTALTSPHVQVRRSAVHHWGFRPGAESLGHLVTALRDDQVEVLKSAIAYLQARPALESVPELIELLRAPSKEIRDQATAALVDIKKHFEAQAEWQRWYDETKKALRK